ncbi:uncharacterized protein B0J16DRAFT_372722 [Fusarium flagelliforme]|uniref:uncharacterized protein n=1 Tax=Fusarium flagelliforme TaxID=2675880 RepID=UPI001E8E4595|nr:uncharacterized protein B0J16DRAFT_372722 [Fusarium flagelliforme]KAH7185984.1 hypothetical protein B0J16DRAFT_372722 [Fusarium flagelliforme]
MPSRKWHSKGRHGCGQCKQRRVKCDVRYYVCSNCERRKEKCDFELLRPALPASDVAQISTPSVLNIGQLLSIDAGNVNAQMWDPIINNLIHTHIFLQHGYEALTVLHSRRMLHMTSLGDYLEAYQKHLLGLQEFRRCSQSEWVPSVVFAMIVSAFEMGVAGIQPGEEFIPNTIVALRNGAQLTRAIAPNFVKDRQRDEMMRTKLPSHERESLLMVKYLENEFKTMGGVDALDTVYKQAIISLRVWVVRVQARPRTWGHVLWWPANLDDNFVDLVRGKDHLAMVIARQWAYIVIIVEGPG